MGFNPQPEPPAYNSSLGIKMNLQSLGAAARSVSGAGSTITWSIEILDDSQTPIALEQASVEAVPGLSGVGLLFLCGGLIYSVRHIHRRRG